MRFFGKGGPLLVATGLLALARDLSPGAWLRFKRDRVGVVSAVIVIAFLLLILFAALGFVALARPPVEVEAYRAAVFQSRAQSREEVGREFLVALDQHGQAAEQARRGRRHLGRVRRLHGLFD